MATDNRGSGASDLRQPKTDPSKLQEIEARLDAMEEELEDALLSAPDTIPPLEDVDKDREEYEAPVYIHSRDGSHYVKSHEVVQDHRYRRHLERINKALQVDR